MGTNWRETGCADMTIKHDLREAGRQAARADAAIDKTFTPLRETSAVRALAFVGKVGDQRQRNSPAPTKDDGRPKI
jgi:hypothetical protein